MHFPLFLCLYKSFWKGFESDQRRLTLLVIKYVCLSGASLIRRTSFVSGQVSVLLRLLILSTFNFPLTTKLKPEIISHGDRELIVNMTILES